MSRGVLQNARPNPFEKNLYLYTSFLPFFYPFYHRLIVVLCSVCYMRTMQERYSLHAKPNSPFDFSTLSQTQKHPLPALNV